MLFGQTDFDITTWSKLLSLNVCRIISLTPRSSLRLWARILFSLVLTQDNSADLKICYNPSELHEIYRKHGEYIISRRERTLRMNSVPYCDVVFIGNCRLEKIRYGLIFQSSIETNCQNISLRLFIYLNVISYDARQFLYLSNAYPKTIVIFFLPSKVSTFARAFFITFHAFYLHHINAASKTTV